MIQDIFPYHLDNHYDPEAEADDESLIVVFREKELLLRTGFEEADSATSDDTDTVADGAGILSHSGHVADSKAISFETAGNSAPYGKHNIYPHLRDFVNISSSDLIYLFSIGDEKFFLLNRDFEEVEFAPGRGALAGADSSLSVHTQNQGFRAAFVFTGIRQLRALQNIEKRYVYAAYTAYQLSEWYDVTRFCGKCGHPNENDKKERARRCPVCGNIIYPRINPAVIIGVTDPVQNKLILTKYRTGFAHNALVAGFTEIGETLEETVEREVMEEVGLKVKNIRYYKSQPWGIASDILAGFFCDVDGDAHIHMDASELKYAEWVSPENIELQPTDYSLTNEMMKLFKDGGYEATKS
ncbi:MAG: NAD(+) diphosphatase [Lachnospiraceae bacterium]|nr:NAD(+) diphosphatase [Lachnospiraceae bacterium]MBR1669866.1 NAD(+) diphosphatase [Butyrivibrio sp.]